MTNPKIAMILSESVEESRQEQFNEKLILIEDIIRIKKMMFGLGFVEHDEYLDKNNAAANLFDLLYEMNLTQLELINSGYEKQVNECLSNKI